MSIVRRVKREGSSKTEFKNVYAYAISINGRPAVNKFCYNKHFKETGKLSCSGFLTAREAALALDKKLIDLGREPINVLKRKTEMV